MHHQRLEAVTNQQHKAQLVTRISPILFFSKMNRAPWRNSLVLVPV
jgi:hypothetical protein